MVSHSSDISNRTKNHQIGSLNQTPRYVDNNGRLEKFNIINSGNEDDYDDFASRSPSGENRKTKKKKKRLLSS
jgi:hypothetical protein